VKRVRSMRATRMNRATTAVISGVVVSALLIAGATFPAHADGAGDDAVVAALEALVEDEGSSDPVEQPDAKKPEGTKAEEEGESEELQRTEALDDAGATLPEPDLGLPDDADAAEHTPGDDPVAEPAGRGPPAAGNDELTPSTSSPNPGTLAVQSATGTEAGAQEIVPLAEPTVPTATVRVKVGGVRTGDTAVSGLAGVTLGLFASESATDPATMQVRDDAGSVTTIPITAVSEGDGWATRALST